jgi:hypothetical protein
MWVKIRQGSNVTPSRKPMAASCAADPRSAQRLAARQRLARHAQAGPKRAVATPLFRSIDDFAPGHGPGGRSGPPVMDDAGIDLGCGVGSEREFALTSASCSLPNQCRFRKEQTRRR